MKKIEGGENIIEDNAPKKHPKKNDEKNDEITILMRKYKEILCDEKNYSKKDGLMYVVVKGKGDNIEISGYYKTFKKANEFAVFVHRVLGIEDARVLTLSK